VGELLLELLSEEIPARMQRRAIEDLVALLQGKLAAAEIPAASLHGYVTPRRLAVIADGIPAHQPDRSEERRGPRVGSPPQAIDGFLRAAGLHSIDECEIRDTDRGQFYFAIRQTKGRPASDILPELLCAAIAELPWPKTMRFPAATLRWVRPLVSVVALFDGAALKLALDRIPVGRTTRGHRFLSEGAITVENARDYREKLEAAHVILDHDRRSKMIEDGLTECAKAEAVRVKPDPALLDEVAGLVEFPVVLMGAIDEASMALPPEVLATAMRTHQKYFSCLNPDETPAPRFLFVANNLTPDIGKTIIAGNERVLRARLADARFFWEQDKKVRLEDRVEALKVRVYHEKLGSVFEKVARVEQVAVFLAQQVSQRPTVIPTKAGIQGSRSDPLPLDSRFRGDDEGELGRLAQRAAHLAKGDLSTGMVGEFPELQGVMGRYYALNDGEDPRVADAIAEHYKPLGPNDSCPTAPVSVIVALADKIDALAAFFAIGDHPSGSRDPFALRRAALGIIRIILENGLRVPLGRAFSHQRSLLKQVVASDAGTIAAATEELLQFVADRLKVHLREQGVRHDLIAAAFETLGVLGVAGRYEDDLMRLLSRVQALKDFLGTDDGGNLLIAYRRASNIVAIEAKRGGWTDGEVDPDRLSQPEEQSLADHLFEIDALTGDPLLGERFEDAMSVLARLRQPVDAFFDAVTVNTDDARLRENRLRLLSRIRAVMNQVADFSQIEG
jgi:glycyl-tRNA synthetase beta chain